MKTKTKIIISVIALYLFASTVYTASALERRVVITFDRPTYTLATWEEVKGLCELKDVECSWEKALLASETEQGKEIIVKRSSSTAREVTAYNTGDISQTDNSPCISANGENICLALEKGYKRCAANFVPFGTILMIEGFGDCMVTDRMNSRFKNRVDIAMKADEKERAIKFGKQNLAVEIIKK